LRSSEEMALVLYHAECSKLNLEPQQWDELSYEHQQLYLAEVNAFLEYLFEHGRISAYINAKQLEEFRAKYRAYLQQKNRGE
jgi:hypothetical protein